jgi:hypothetical protein
LATTSAGIHCRITKEIRIRVAIVTMVTIGETGATAEITVTTVPEEVIVEMTGTTMGHGVA